MRSKICVHFRVKVISFSNAQTIAVVQSNPKDESQTYDDFVADQDLLYYFPPKVISQSYDNLAADQSI